MILKWHFQYYFLKIIKVGWYGQNVLFEKMSGQNVLVQKVLRRNVLDRNVRSQNVRPRLGPHYN